MHLPTRSPVAAVVTAFALAGGLSGVATEPPGIVTATVGKPFRLQIDAKGARQRIALGPELNGLRVKDGLISGIPAKPMVMFAAREGADTTWIVAFAPGLPTPALPGELYGYVGRANAVPPHMTISFGIAGSNPEADAAAANPVTDAGATLGRVLFHDTRLSANDRVSCSSCHLQSKGFGDTAQFSRGVNGHTKRHAMALANVRYVASGGFSWDQRAPTLEEQVLLPIQDSIEMAMKLPDLTRKLQATDYYPALFTAAFGTPEITTQKAARALAQFLRSLVPADSPFDRAAAPLGGPRAAVPLTPQQAAGFALFNRSGCSLCHVTGTLTVFRAMNSGLDSVSADSGAGRAMFRPPSLRNVAIRPPYMHDGRFRSLDEVIDFYASKVHNTPNLDARLRERSGVRRLNLSAADRAALVAFLNALTDSTFLVAPEFSDPFSRTPHR